MKEIPHSELWINTEYFINAFRCVCSLNYLEKHNEICQFINAKDFIDGKLHRFYINLCALVDIHCDYSKNKKNRAIYKKMLKTMYPAFDWIFYERDKNAAHKDSNYKINLDINMPELINKMKKAISTTQNICSNVLSDKIEYEYYAYDSLLFRYINGITPSLEKDFNNFFNNFSIKKQFDTNANNFIIFDNISDTRQIRNLNTNKDYCIINTGSLCFHPYDMLEHMQDTLIKLNAWKGYDSWVTLQTTNAEKMLEIFFKLFNSLKK